eukprot:1110294-Rhodomonas_salina.1
MILSALPTSQPHPRPAAGRGGSAAVGAWRGRLGRRYASWPAGTTAPRQISTGCAKSVPGTAEAVHRAWRPKAQRGTHMQTHASTTHACLALNTHTHTHVVGRRHTYKSTDTHANTYDSTWGRQSSHLMSSTPEPSKGSSSSDWTRYSESTIST